jgi:hypothetical protein
MTRNNALFAFISQNWRGKPLISHKVIVQLIAATKTAAGLTISCDIDAGSYPKGGKISDAQLAAINIRASGVRATSSLPSSKKSRCVAAR